MHTNKILIAEFGLGTGLHMDYQTMLLDNNIEFDSLIRTDYDGGVALDIMSFYVSASDIEKSRKLKEKLLLEHQGVKWYPKFVKIFLIIFFLAILGLVVLYYVIDFYDLAFPTK